MNELIFCQFLLPSVSTQITSINVLSYHTMLETLIKKHCLSGNYFIRNNLNHRIITGMILKMHLSVRDSGV